MPTGIRSRVKSVNIFHRVKYRKKYIPPKQEKGNDEDFEQKGRKQQN